MENYIFSQICVNGKPEQEVVGKSSLGNVLGRQLLLSFLG